MFRLPSQGEQVAPNQRSQIEFSGPQGLSSGLENAVAPNKNDYVRIDRPAQINFDRVGQL